MNPKAKISGMIDRSERSATAVTTDEYESCLVRNPEWQKFPKHTSVLSEVQFHVGETVDDVASETAPAERARMTIRLAS